MFSLTKLALLPPSTDNYQLRTKGTYHLRSRGPVFDETPPNDIDPPQPSLEATSGPTEATRIQPDATRIDTDATRKAETMSEHPSREERERERERERE